jgi:ATP-binding cassette subfamily B protein/subfamily B ATP-binding cassette protein MsbA
MKRTVRFYLKPYRLTFAFALAQVTFISAFELLKPWPLKIVIDHVLMGEPLTWELVRGWPPHMLLSFACVTLVLIYAFAGGLRIFNDYTTIRIGQGMVNDLRRDLYSHVQRLSLAFHNRQEIGDLMYRITADTLALQTIAMNGIFTVLSAAVLLLGMFSVMLWMDWYLTLLAMAVCPLLLGVMALLNDRMSNAASHARHKESAVYSVVQRALAGIRVIQAFTKEDEEERRFIEASRESLAADLRLYNLQNVYCAAINIMIAAGTAMVLWLGARQVLAGSMSVGEMIVFASYLASLYAPLNSIFETYGLVQSGKAGLRRAFAILDSEQGLADGRRTLSPREARGRIVFEDVSFKYDGSPPVLKKINLKVAPGEMIAIVGPTGAGKSTLMSMLPRFFDPQSGRITIDGVDLREFRLRSLRRHIAMVLQPPLVFPLTIAENIAYGRPNATRQEIYAAAAMAGIADMIARLPQGYETKIGEQGVTLSEGEKQRLTIARAILIDAPILILDEPTSSVDAETEALIMDGLEQLLTGKTAFIIAHRLSTVRRADSILLLRDGEIVERGTFSELLRRQGQFAALYRTQFGLQDQSRHFRVIK